MTTTDLDESPGPQPDGIGEVDPQAALAGLAALRSRRRARRTADVHWFDAFYQAYITALFAGIAILLASGAVGGGHVSEAGVSRVLADGPAVLGLLAALAIGAGLRSGSRGGPLALEPAEVQHALLAPLPIQRALRGPAIRQVRTLLFIAAVVGAVAGQLITRRLDGGAAAWIGSAVLWVVLTALAAVAAGWLAAGHRLDRRVATGLGAAVVAWAIADLTEVLPSSPTSVLGRIALWPLEFEPLALIAAAIIVIAAVVGLRSLGGISLEHAQRRSSLVGELRFAATMRDLRTVIVLRRQLMQERSRTRPWIPTRHRGGRTLVVLRGWRSLDRTPSARLARMAGLGVAAALSARAAWDGATPMLVVAGLAAFIAGLDAVEPLAQEVDHPSFAELTPTDSGDVLVRHLIVPALTMLMIGVVGLAATAATRPTATGWAVAAITAAAAALTGAAGAAISTVKDISGNESSNTDSLLVPPEAAGTRLIFQAVWPPAVATLGFAPLIAAREAAANGNDPVAAAAQWALPVVFVVTLVAGWVRFRAEIHTWWKSVMDQSMGAQGAESGRT